MAGTKTSDMEVWEQLKDITECCVCSKTYKDPKILPCIHTFCRACLEKIGCKTSISPGNQMPCPICRKEFMIPEVGYAALQKNFFVEKLIEMAQIARPSDGTDLCEACMEEESKSMSASEVPLAVMYCADCQKKLCQKCTRYHRKNKLTRNHQVIRGRDFKCKLRIVAPSSCMKHKSEFDLYCSNRKRLLCKSCFGESQHNCRLQDVRDTVEGCENGINDRNTVERCEKEIKDRNTVEGCENEIKDRNTVEGCENEIEDKNTVEGCENEIKDRNTVEGCENEFKDRNTVEGCENEIKDRNTVEGCDNEIKDSLSSVQVCESDVLERKVILNCGMEKYCENLASLKLEVLGQTDATVKLVNEHANLILQDIDQLKVQKQNEVQGQIDYADRYLTCLESFKVDCAEVVINESSSDVGCAINKLKAKAEEIKKQLESETEKKIHFRKMSFQKSDLEEFVKTVDYNIIGIIQVPEDETETTSDNISHDGNTNVEDDCRVPISGNNGILAKVNHLKQELEIERRRINHLKQELEIERRRICGLEIEKKTSEKEVNELKLELGIKRPQKSTFSGSEVAQAAQRVAKQVHPARLSIDYKRSPNLVKTLQSLKGDRSLNGESIFGLTVMDDELFLGCFIDHSVAVVEVYDVETFSFKRWWQVKSQSNMAYMSSCMASCARDKCLYACVVILEGFVRGHLIQRTDVNGLNAKEWSIKGSSFVSNLSVSGEGNIIVITDNNSVNEYSRDGALVHEMKLRCSLYIEHPLHVLKLANGCFAISHGLGEDLLHRVVIFSESGKITKSFGKIAGSGVRFFQANEVSQVYDPELLYEPVFLTVDGLGNILVADFGNNRIVVLNSNLELESSINTTQPLQKPICMCFDAAGRRLFVCEGLKKISVLDFYA